MPAAQVVGPGPVISARHGRTVGAQWQAAAVPVPVVELPAAWLALVTNNVGFVGPLMAQVFLARGDDRTRAADGSALIGGAVLVSAAGKPFAFSSAGSFDMWASIAAARVVREVELVGGMTPESRAVWLAGKREKLEKEARGRVNAAAKVSDENIKAALIADADFALTKWAIYQ